MIVVVVVVPLFQVSQSYGAFNHILGDLSLIVNQFESLSAFSAGIDRLGEFLERMQGELNDAGGFCFCVEESYRPDVERVFAVLASECCLCPVRCFAGRSRTITSFDMSSYAFDRLLFVFRVR